MTNYQTIYDRMEKDKLYSAADLGAAGATMNAMIKRGMVEKINGKPTHYRKLDNGKLLTIKDAADKNGCDYFVVYKADAELGMLCSYDKKTLAIKDCYGKNYNIASAVKVAFWKKGIKTELILEGD